MCQLARVSRFHTPYIPQEPQVIDHQFETASTLRARGAEQLGEYAGTILMEALRLMGGRRGFRRRRISENQLFAFADIVHHQSDANQCPALAPTVGR
jgi:hypothetical protein